LDFSLHLDCISRKTYELEATERSIEAMRASNPQDMTKRLEEVVRSLVGIILLILVRDGILLKVLIELSQRLEEMIKITISPEDLNVL
jgi:lipopolysaccharide/colanic/teichoic acid biosynthesis glycosyltransferase